MEQVSLPLPHPARAWEQWKTAVSVEGKQPGLSSANGQYL